MALTATFLADFSSFLDATRESVAAMQGFKESAEEMGPAADRGLAETEKQWEQIGRQVRRVGEDALGAAQTFITAYAEEEEATARLVAALEAQGIATSGVVDSYASMAEQFQKTTRFSDDAVISAQAVLTTIGKVGPEQMQLALDATTNLASGMKIDLAQAATMVAKGFASGGENLGKLKSILGETSTEVATGTDLLNALNKQFAGQAAADVRTYSGSMENLNNQMDNLRGTIGETLVKNLRWMLDIFQALPQPVQTAAIAITAIGTALAPVLISLSSLASLLSAPIVVSGITAAFSAILPFLGPAGLIAAGVVAVIAVWKNWDQIVGFVSGVYNAVKTYLVDRFTGLIDSIKAKIGEVVGTFRWLYNEVVGHSYVPDMIDGIGQHFSRLDRVMVKPAEQSLAYVADLFKKYTAMYGGVSSLGAIGGGPAKDFLSYAMGMFPGLTPENVMQGLQQGRAGAVAGYGAAQYQPNITINMSGMLGTDDPQTRSQVRRLVGDAMIEGMRESRLMGRA